MPRRLAVLSGRRGARHRTIRHRFADPVAVPDDGVGARLTVSGVIEKKLDDRTVVVVLTVRSDERPALTQAQATVRLA